MVKKIRVLDEAVAEDTKDEASMENFYELAKTMDWKLWEILQIMQRLEKKLGNINVSADDDEDA